MTDTAPTPQPDGLGAQLRQRIDLSDHRNLIGLGVMCFCLGLMAGARIMRGAMPGEARVEYRDVPGPVVYRDVPCRDCAEKRIRDNRTARDGFSDEDHGRGEVVERQHVDSDHDGLRTFSPYTDATLPDEQVVGPGDSSLPIE